MNPVAYHVGDLFFHAANALVLFVLVQSLLRAAGYDRMHGNDSAVRIAAAVGALFFAIHPLRVEAVAWATDRAPFEHNLARFRQQCCWHLHKSGSLAV